MTHNGFQDLIQINSRLEMVFWNLIRIDSRLKWLSRIWIQVDSRLKKLSRVVIQISSQLKKLSRSFIQIDLQLKSLSGILFRSTHESIIPLLLGLWPIGFDLVWRFWACPIPFHLAWSFLGLSTQMSSREIDSNQLMTQAVCRRVESIQLMTKAAFQGIDSESTHDSSGSPGIDSDRLMIQAAFQGIDSESTHDSSGSPDIDSNRLMSQAKNIWFWVDSWFNSESYPCLHHSHRNRSGIMRRLATTLHALTLVKQSWCIVLLSELSRLRSDLHSVLWEHDTLTPQGEVWCNVRRTITFRSSSKNLT